MSCLKHIVGNILPLIAKLRKPAAAIVLLFATAVSACQPVSRPFQPDKKITALAGYLEPGPRAGLIVNNLGTLPDQSLRRISEILVASLRDRNIAATTDSDNHVRYRLLGNFELEHDPSAAPEDTLTVIISWQLFDIHGDITGSVVQEELISTSAWRDFSETTMMSIIDRATPRIEHLLDGYGNTSNPSQPLDAVVVYKIDGATGDGEAALLRGMKHELKMRQIPVVDSITKDTYVVLGLVQIGDGNSSSQQIVKIDWTVIHPDGYRVGSIRQSNSIAAGKLSGAWGAIATAVAYRGADGIVSLLKAIGFKLPNVPINR